MTKAFDPGDPVLELAALGQGIPITVLETEDQPWIRKAEQLKIDEVCAFESNIFRYRTSDRIQNAGAGMSLTLSRLVHRSDLCLENMTLTSISPVDCQWYTPRTLPSHHWRERHGEIINAFRRYAESRWGGYLHVRSACRP